MSRLSQMLAHEAKKRERSVSDLSREFGWSKQAFYTWTQGSIPRDQWHRKIAEFLKINLDDLEMLVEEAGTSSGNTKIPSLGAPVVGSGGKQSIKIDKHPNTYVTPRVEGCYAIRVGGRAHWVHPRIPPKTGSTVFIRTDTEGRLARWPAEVADGERVDVVILAEMV